VYFNRCIFVGRLTRDPEMRFTSGGTAVATFTLAVDRPYLNAQGERETDFIRVVAWRKLAETCTNNLSKGRLVLVEGRLQIGSYTDKEGVKRRTFDIIADTVRFLDSNHKKESAGVPEADTPADVPTGVPESDFSPEPETADVPAIDWPEEPPF
jgi:single-strand DNA-binding protein